MEQQWNEDRFCEWVKGRRSEQEVNVAISLCAWPRKHGFEWSWGGGPVEGVGSLRIEHHGEPFTVFSIHTNKICPSIWIQFDNLRNHTPFDNLPRRLEIVERLNKFDGIKIDRSRADRSQVTIKLVALADANVRDAVLEVFNGVLEDLRRDSK